MGGSIKGPLTDLPSLETRGGNRKPGQHVAWEFGPRTGNDVKATGRVGAVGCFGALRPTLQCYSCSVASRAPASGRFPRGEAGRCAGPPERKIPPLWFTSLGPGGSPAVHLGGLWKGPVHVVEHPVCSHSLFQKAPLPIP